MTVAELVPQVAAADGFFISLKNALPPSYRVKKSQMRRIRVVKTSQQAIERVNPVSWVDEQTSEATSFAYAVTVPSRF